MITPEQIAESLARVRAVVSERVVGQEAVIDEALVAFLARGHALLEGVPGTAKTLLVRVLAAALNMRFGRIQFTPDLMPSDITGINVLRDGGRSAEFRAGPVFTDLLLADEINRAPAKTQAALLEAMQRAAGHGRRRGRDRSASCSRCSRRRTRWSTRAPIRCPRRSSTASCSRSASPIRRARRSWRCSPTTRAASTPSVRRT